MSSIYEALKRSQASSPEQSRSNTPYIVRGRRIYWIVAAAVLISSALTAAAIFWMAPERGERSVETVAAQPVTPGPVRTLELMNKGDRLRRKNDLEGAVAAYQEVIKETPDYAEAHLQLGELFYGAGRFDEAFAAMAKAQKLRPDDARLLNNMGSVLLAKDNAAEALNYFVQARRNSADYVEPLYNMACAYAKLKKKDAALSSLRQAAEMQPEVRLWASRDPDLVSLRGDRDFESIVHPKE
ncbi:MAG TPA: tetratricopeptide repeat protein [Deltaproteobacteria bacterium]|jgi:tetratricopeptide (TPR) repeat protein|nr:tetratricopeptide repeat protein [Deltaproteobacteria bacterium]OQC28359.1 MAG: tetratricopeptide repeat protein [Deltaproteobacteria bacterium ADurb.Bin072]HRW79249.1 tetratricopeptide repeat protein [Desulfomonilia bacterium]NMD40238.1 tetratricopeptide repeat protein [Deltaproteobacteria bacterium]HNQ85129.1 tetratricopeptide repeat protein [Deltaproteobacteria bacterium]